MTKETLEQIRKYAQLQLEPYEVEIQCELEDGAIAESEEATRAWWVGRTQGKVNSRTIIMQGVRDGSIQAAREMNKCADQATPENEE